MNLWQRKLLAYLHDPPSKPFNVAEHRKMAETLIRNAGFEPADVAWFFDKVCDHTAAAADRVVCPKSSALRAEWNESTAFKHPMGGGELHFEQPIKHTEAETQVAAQQPHGYDWSKVSTEQEGQDWAKFFIHWRLWRQFCAEKHPSLAHMPADTRIPDHTIWTHCNLVSALQASVEIANAGPNVEVRLFKPAFLVMQIGPVQEFIAQARTTRDLWSGSYLLSWLISHGIKAVTDAVGPDCVLFPSLRAQPLFDFLHKDSLYEPLGIWEERQRDGSKKRMHAEEHILTPNLPNRFLAVVPMQGYEVEGRRIPSSGELAKVAKEAMEKELAENISQACLAWFAEKAHAVPSVALDRWRQQVSQFLNVTWQVWPWEHDVKHAIDSMRHSAETQSLALAYDAAISSIPKGDQDPRNYRHQSWMDAGGWHSKITDDPPVIENPGFAWAAHYAGAEFQLAARRNTRDFEAWADNDDKRDGAVKDMLSGKEEVIGSKDWQKGLSNIPGHHFREHEQLGAMNLIKRIWHIAYLQPKDLKRTPRFDSLPSVAAATFAIEVVDKMVDDDKAWPLLLDFQRAATAAKDDYGAEVSAENSEKLWIERSDASIFHINEWEREIRETKDHAAKRRLTDARDTLNRLLGKRGLNDEPRGYVAVLAMDGDSMGQWVSGAKSPKSRGHLAVETVSYFEKHDKLRQLLDTQRPVSPSYHAQLSEALANFALYLAGPIVECFDGQIIYAGGDDVLAMLPAEQALPCARALRMAFRGDPDLPNVFEGALNAKTDQWGFVGLDGDTDIFRRTKRFVPRGHPLVVPGQNADISAGIAIGHMHSPLQNLVEAARQAEKRAKQEYGKAAFAISLFKRSGETTEWGAKWDSHAIDLADCFAESSGDGKPLSAKFPYALAGLLRPYAIDAEFRIAKNNGFDPFAVFTAEFAHVVKQQGRDVPDRFSKLAGDYLNECANRRLDDFLGPFLTTTFINRGGGE